MKPNSSNHAGEIPTEESLLRALPEDYQALIENGVDSQSKRTESIVSGEEHTWLIPFFINIFMACASFSIVMPSLAPYILEIGAPLSFLPWVVSFYSVGEMIGSIFIGYFYEFATKEFRTPGRGPRLSIILSIFLGIWGSMMYAVAGWIEDEISARYCLLFGRLIQGVWTGGQQAVEQAYLSAAVHPTKRVEYTATLSTCAVLGFVTGPSIGAALSQIDTTIYNLPVNANNSPGIFIFIATVIMLIQTAACFDGKDDRTGDSEEEVDKMSDLSEQSESEEKALNGNPFNSMGVSMSIILFFVHYYSFAVQETITTPMVSVIYNWSSLKINLLFTGAGMASLLTSFSVRCLTRYVEDRSMLVASIVIGLIGSMLLMDEPFNKTLPVWRFLVGFSLTTIAFPVGRNVVLGVFGNVLGPVNQGRWMGIIIAVSALPRVLGPFLALKTLELIYWKTWLEFGICTALFGVAILGTLQNIRSLVPYSEFIQSQHGNKSEPNALMNSYNPVPSPLLARSPASSLRRREF